MNNADSIAIFFVINIIQSLVILMLCIGWMEESNQHASFKKAVESGTSIQQAYDVIYGKEK